MKVLIGAVLFATLIGGVMMYIAWGHNAQCEIHCNGVVNWSYWLMLGGAWFVVSFVSALAGLYGFSWLWRQFVAQRENHLE